MTDGALIEQAKGVLDANWRDGYTVPHGALYPFQWLWDSGFAALGYGHYDGDRAQKELRSLLEGQWSNGLLPHIVFHRTDPGYFPGPDEWQAWRSLRLRPPTWCAGSPSETQESWREREDGSAPMVFWLSISSGCSCSSW